MATRTASSLGKPAAKGGAQDGMYSFHMPTKERMDEQRGGGRAKLPDKTWHQMKVTNVVFKHAESSGNPMWEWDLIVMAGQYAGQTFKLWTALTDSAAWKVQETLEALGQDCPPGEEITLDKKAVIGAACEGFVVDDDRPGKEDFSKLDKIRPHPKGAGFRPGKLTVEEEPWDGAGTETEPEPAPRRAAKPAPKAAAPAGRGRAPVALGKKR